LLSKLFRSFGVKGQLLKIIRDYLDNRTQQVRIDDATSNYVSAMSGVPQGSLLGPLLFLVYIDDLPLYIQGFTCLMLADDSKVLSRGVSLQPCLLELQRWASENRMSFNVSKTKLVTFSGKPPVYLFCGETIINTRQHKDLGLITDSSLSWDPHITEKLGKCNRLFHMIRRNVSPIISVTSKLNVYKSVILATLTYASPCWSPSKSAMRKLEALQRRVTKWIVPWIHVYNERLVFLKILPIPMYLQLLDVLAFVKIAAHKFDMDETKYINFSASSGRDSRILPVIPRTRLEITHNDFFVRTPRLIRFLPEVIDCSNPVGLKARLLAHLWTVYEGSFDENNTCTWRLACRCANCRS
jgi:ribonuclease P/MRP protein subunit RPP40